MPFTSTGIFERVHHWEEDRINGIEIVTDHHDAEDDNFADGLSLALLRDGRVAMENTLNMGGNRIINCEAGVNPNDVVTKSQLDMIDTNFVPINGDCEVFDTKVFISSPLMPTLLMSESSQKGATTAFVHHVVEDKIAKNAKEIAKNAFPTYQEVKAISRNYTTPSCGFVIFELPTRMVGQISIGNYKKSFAYNYNNTQPTEVVFPVAEGVLIDFEGCSGFFVPVMGGDQ